MNVNYLVYLSMTEVLDDLNKDNENETSCNINNTTESIAKQHCPSSGVYPNLVFILSIQKAPCQLKFRTVKLSDEDYIINVILSGINRVGKSEVRVMQLNTNKILNKQGRNDVQQSPELKEKSVIQRIKHGLILPLLNMQSLTLSAMPGHIVVHILSYCQAVALCRLSSVSKQFNQLTSDDTLWSNLFKKSFEPSSKSKDTISTELKTAPNLSMKEVFKSLYLKKQSHERAVASISSSYNDRQRQQAQAFHMMDPFYPSSINNNDLDPDFNLNFNFPYDTNPLEIERRNRNQLYCGQRFRSDIDTTGLNEWRPPVMNDGTNNNMMSTGFPRVFQH